MKTLPMRTLTRFELKRILSSQGNLTYSPLSFMSSTRIELKFFITIISTGGDLMSFRINLRMN